MESTASADIIIVGGGIAGLVTANRAAQLGLKALVLEQGAEDKYLCNSRYTGGTLHLCLRDLMIDEAVMARTIVEITEGFVAVPLAEMLARDGRRIVQWLRDEGIKFIRASGAEHQKYVLAPPATLRPGLNWEGRGGDVMLRTLGANLEKRGGRVARATRARELIVKDGCCTGLIASRNGTDVRFDGSAVVLADGGFQGNSELVQRYICRRPERLKQRGAGTGRGDALLMAMAVGAATRGMDRFYGHMLSREAMTNEKLWPHPYLDSIVTAGIVVAPDGRRFVDEGISGVYVANAVAKLDDPLGVVAIFDQAIWDGPGRSGVVSANPNLPQVGGTVHVANDLISLARLAGLPGDALTATVHAYNEKIAAGALQSLAPPRRISSFRAWPITQPPYYAVPVCAGITNTMGGVVVNEHAQAMRADGSIIDGLYAVGATTGGLEGGPAVGYVGGLAKGGITGLHAAEHIAAQRAG